MYVGKIEGALVLPSIYTNNKKSLESFDDPFKEV